MSKNVIFPNTATMNNRSKHTAKLKIAHLEVRKNCAGKCRKK